jgi:hypothetical protein
MGSGGLDVLPRLMLQPGETFETDQAAGRPPVLHAIDETETPGHEGGALMQCDAGAPVFAHLRSQQIERMNMFA